MAGGLATQFKLGRAGSELNFGGTTTAMIIPPFQVDISRLEVENRNAQGERKTRVSRRLDVDFSIKMNNVSDAVRDQVIGLSMIADSYLSLIFADDWQVIAERYTMDSLTSFPLRSTPYLLLDQAYNSLSPTGSAILSSFTVSSSYTGSGNLTGSITITSYDRANGRVNISPTQTTNQVVYVNYVTDGASVKFSRPPKIVQSSSFQSGSSRGWDLTLMLRGV